MAIQKITNSTPSTSNPNMNKRWPPMADKTSLPFKLTNLSRQKLAREATAADPDIRRCLGHFRLHCTSMEWAQKDMTSRINSFDLEDDTESEDEEETQHPLDRFREEVTTTTPQPEIEQPAETTTESAKSTDSEPESDSTDTESTESTESISTTITEPETESTTQDEVSASKEASDTKEPEIHLSFQVETVEPSQPPSPTEKEKENNLLEKGRSCLEKTAQRKHFWPSPGQCLPVRISG